MFACFITALLEPQGDQKHLIDESKSLIYTSEILKTELVLGCRE